MTAQLVDPKTFFSLRHALEAFRGPPKTSWQCTLQAHWIRAVLEGFLRWHGSPALVQLLIKESISLVHAFAGGGPHKHCVNDLAHVNHQHLHNGCSILTAPSHTVQAASAMHATNSIASLRHCACSDWLLLAYALRQCSCQLSAQCQSVSKTTRRPSLRGLTRS